MRKLIAGAALALIVSSAGGTAFAGEITGSGKGGPNGDGTPGATQGRAQSICAFSGLNDFPDDPIEGGRVQSYGQIPKAVRDTLPAEEHPGNACNGNHGFLAGGGVEP